MPDAACRQAEGVLLDQAFFTVDAGVFAKFQQLLERPLPPTDRSRQNAGLGRALLRDAKLKAVHIASDTEVSAISVHALSDTAKRFYMSRGFVESPLQPMTLMMTIATIRAILSELE